MFWMIGGIYASAMAWAIIPHYGEENKQLTHSGNQHLGQNKGYTSMFIQIASIFLILCCGNNYIEILGWLQMFHVVLFTLDTLRCQVGGDRVGALQCEQEGSRAQTVC